jgi:hypothetical protein
MNQVGSKHQLSVGGEIKKKFRVFATNSRAIVDGGQKIRKICRQNEKVFKFNLIIQS